METMYGSGLNTTVTCEKEALSVLLVSAAAAAALVGSYVLAQDYLSLVLLTNKDGTKGDGHVKKHSEPCDAVSDVGSEDDDDDDDGGDAGLGEGDEDLPSDEGEAYGNPNNKSNAKKDPLDGADGAEENGDQEQEDDEAGGDDDNDEDENDDDEDDDDDDDDDDDGGEDDEDEPGSEEEEDEEEETLQPPKKRKKQN